MLKQKAPCDVCPFRKTSLPSWLGGEGTTPEEFLRTMELAPIPCHKVVDWNEELTEEELRDIAMAKPCIGSLIFMRNSCKLPWDKIYAAMRDSVQPSDQVFQFKADFIEHHKSRL